MDDYFTVIKEKAKLKVMVEPEGRYIKIFGDMMGEEIKRMEVEAVKIKSAMLKDNNIDILLYLAKYNPKVTLKEIEGKLGKASGFRALVDAGLVSEEGGGLSLTNSGLFQVEGLLALVV